MPNYEECYYTARNKYYEAIETRNNIRLKTADLQSSRRRLNSELNQQKTNLRKEKNKLSIVQKAEDKCRKILDNEFEKMKNGVQKASDEYQKIIKSDSGVANIQQIYSEDINKTNNDLQTILQELGRVRQKVEEDIEAVNNAINNSKNELNNVKHELNNTGSYYDAQRQVNSYYYQMKYYQRKWQNGY